MNNAKNRLSLPIFTDSMVERPEVNKAIDAVMEKNIIYIHAPAGFGKTIAMSMWLSNKSLSSAWIPLSVYDDEPIVFCRYLLIALAELNSNAAGPAKTALSDPGFPDAPFEYLFRAVSSMPGEIAQGVIVMDDFHLIENAAVLDALQQIIRKLSQIHKLVILSRLKPPVSLSDLVLKDDLGELTENNLRFTKKQIVGLYKNYGIALSHREAAEIEENTGGWALGLGAELLSIKRHGNESFLSRASGEKYIDGYLKREVWDKWDADTQEFLLKTSILEDLTPELCNKLCNYDSEKVLSRLMSDSGLVVRISDGSFRYHHILRDFLRRMVDQQGADLTVCYIDSAAYLLEKGNSNAALDYAVKSGDFETIARVLYGIIGYETTIKSVEEFCNSVFNSVLKKIPISVLESSVYALTPCTLASNLNGDLDIFYKWRSLVYALVEQEHITDPWLLTGIWLYEFVTPKNSLRDILRLAPSELGELEFENLPSPVVTCNFPFFHRSHRDYSDVANEWAEIAPAFITAFNAISGNIVFLLTFGLECGILYEKNMLTQANEKAIELLSRLDGNTNPELLFSAYMHLAAIEFAKNDEESAWNTIHKAEIIVERDALYLLKNLNAMITKYRLYKGDRNAAEEWLSRYAIDEKEASKFYRIYQTFTTIRAKISIGEFASALVILTKLEKLVTDYRRSLDQIEIHILRAIVLWKQKQWAESVDSIEKAVSLAQPYGFIRIFANEGAAVLPFLQKLYNRLSSNPEKSDIAVFVRTVQLLANEGALSNPGLTSSLEETSVKLSKQQMRMLLYLASGKNNRQICEETGLKLNTVKAHLFKLYEKLEVGSATEAVLKSYRLGIIDRNTSNE